MKGERTTKPVEMDALSKKAKEEADVAHWEDIASDLPDFPSLAEEYRELKDDIKVMEDRCKEIQPELEAAVMIGGKKALAAGDIKVTRVSHPGQAKFVPERVVEKGIEFGLTPEQVTELLEYIVTRVPYTYPLVSRVPTGVTVDE